MKTGTKEFLVTSGLMLVGFVLALTIQQKAINPKWYATAPATATV